MFFLLNIFFNYLSIIDFFRNVVHYNYNNNQSNTSSSSSSRLVFSNLGMNGDSAILVREEEEEEKIIYRVMNL